MGNVDDPHANAPVHIAGTPLDESSCALILLHGRGATAESILELAPSIGAEGMAFLAPQAFRGTWYPHSFLEPIEENEPWLTSALACVGRTLAMATSAGLATGKICIGGFSQGACLSLEFAVRNPMRYGALLGFSGGVIGPPGTAWNENGTLSGTPAFLGCSDVDFHIPVERVYETEALLKGLGASVTTRIYSQMGHTINQDEISICKSILSHVGESVG